MNATEITVIGNVVNSPSRNRTQNGSVTNFTIVSGSKYNFDVVPDADGDVTVSVAADKAVDSAGIGNMAAAGVTIVSDRTVPTAVISTTAADVGGVPVGNGRSNFNYIPERFRSEFQYYSASLDYDL